MDTLEHREAERAIRLAGLAARFMEAAEGRGGRRVVELLHGVDAAHPGRAPTCSARSPRARGATA